MSDSPVKLLARKQVFRNAVFSVYSDHIRDAAGNEVRDYLSIVPHHRAVDGVTGVAVLPVVDGRFALLRVYRHPLGSYSWEITRGFVDNAETPAAAALRELREETGLVAEDGSLRELGVIAPEAGVIEARIRLYAAEGCRQVAGANGVEVGHHEVRHFSREALAALIERGEIVDPCTLVCCCRYLSPLFPAPAPGATTS